MLAQKTMRQPSHLTELATMFPIMQVVTRYQAKRRKLEVVNSQPMQQMTTILIHLKSNLERVRNEPRRVSRGMKSNRAMEQQLMYAQIELTAQQVLAGSVIRPKK